MTHHRCYDQLRGGGGGAALPGGRDGNEVANNYVQQSRQLHASTINTHLIHHVISRQTDLSLILNPGKIIWMESECTWFCIRKGRQSIKLEEEIN